MIFNKFINFAVSRVLRWPLRVSPQCICPCIIFSPRVLMEPVSMMGCWLTPMLHCVAKVKGFADVTEIPSQLILS